MINSKKDSVPDSITLARQRHMAIVSENSILVPQKKD